MHITVLWACRRSTSSCTDGSWVQMYSKPVLHLIASQHLYRSPMFSDRLKEMASAWLWRTQSGQDGCTGSIEDRGRPQTRSNMTKISQVNVQLTRWRRKCYIGDLGRFTEDWVPVGHALADVRRGCTALVLCLVADLAPLCNRSAVDQNAAHLTYTTTCRVFA